MPSSFSNRLCFRISRPCTAIQPGSFLLLLAILFLGNVAPTQARSALPKKDKSAKTRIGSCFTVEAYVQDERFEACQNELVTLVAEANNLVPSSVVSPNSAQARKAALALTFVWQAPAGASLNTYTGDEVIASFSTSGPKMFTVTASDGVCSATATVSITTDLLPNITIFFPNSQTLVPISDGIPTVTQITLPNTIGATQGVLYEWFVVIDRINGYEIRQGDTNTTGIFGVSHVGPYVLTVTTNKGCKRTVRSTLVLAPSGG